MNMSSSLVSLPNANTNRSWKREWRSEEVDWSVPARVSGADLLDWTETSSKYRSYHSPEN